MSDSIQNLTDDQRVEQLAAHYKAILELLGEDPAREGLVKNSRTRSQSHAGPYLGIP